MSPRLWSFCLQWSRVGVGALVFLIAARHLTLVEIGLFATAYAPIRLTQGLHKAGVAEAAILMAHRPRRLDSLFVASLTTGALITAILALIAYVITNPMLAALATIPLLNGLSAVSEGLLRHRLHIRALALRTAASQTLAAIAALYALQTGWGAWSLALFAVLNAGLTCALSLWLARWQPQTWPNLRKLALIWPKTAQLAARDILSSAQLPLAQLAIAAAFGLPAAGAFQIATRLLSLIDALAISPLRYLALPQLRRAPNRARALQDHLRLTTPLAAWIWAGTYAAAPQILTLAVGPDHAASATPLLRALTLFGVTGALLMPITQALTALGHTRLVLTRAAVLLATGIALSLPTLALNPTATAAALSAAALITSLWYLNRALPLLDLTPTQLKPHAAPLIAATTMAATLIGLSFVITNLPAIPFLALQIATGTALFAGLLALSRRKALP